VIKDITLIYICYDVTSLLYIMFADWFLEKKITLENTAIWEQSWDVT